MLTKQGCSFGAGAPQRRVSQLYLQSQWQTDTVEAGLTRVGGKSEMLPKMLTKFTTNQATPRWPTTAPPLRTR